MVKRLFAMLVVLVAVSAWSREARPVQGPASPKGDGAARSAKGNPYKGKPIYLVDGYPLTNEELERFAERVLVMASLEMHERKNPEQMLQSYIRYKVVVDEGMRNGLDGTEEFRNVVEAYRRTALANDFVASIRDGYVPSEGEMKAVTPASWVQYKFKVLAFPTMDEAIKARKKISTPAEFNRISGKIALGAESTSGSTGFIFRKSGFFEEFDEVDLFAMRPGTISQPIPTGIGPAICLVEDRREMTPAEIKKYMDERVTEIKDRHTQKIVQEITADMDYHINREALNQAVIAEGKTGGQPDTEILTFDKGALRITYRQARLMVPVNLTPYFRSFPEKSWINFFEAELINFIKLLELGEEAMKRKIHLTAKWDKEMYDFRFYFLYSKTLTHLLSETKVSVTEKEARQSYERNKEIFHRKPVVQVKYVYAPDAVAMKKLTVKLGGRKALFASPEMENQVKTAVFRKDDKVWGSMFGKAYRLNKGEVSDVIQGEAGSYVFLLMEKDEGRKVPFSEVKNQIMESLSYEKKAKAVNDRINKLAGGVRVVKM